MTISTAGEVGVGVVVVIEICLGEVVVGAVVVEEANRKRKNQNYLRNYVSVYLNQVLLGKK
jgi:hypothetical protein